MEFKLNTHCIPKAAIQIIFLQNMLQCDVLAQEISDGKRGLQKPVADVGVFWWLGFFFLFFLFLSFWPVRQGRWQQPQAKSGKMGEAAGHSYFLKKG